MREKKAIFKVKHISITISSPYGVNQKNENQNNSYKRKHWPSYNVTYYENGSDYCSQYVHDCIAN